jgi:hypothetical protein
MAFLSEKDEIVQLRQTIAKLRKIIQATHGPAVKHTHCEKPYCPICEGGLYVCSHCGAAEIEAEERICTGAALEATSPAPKVTDAVVVFERKIGMYGQAFDPVGPHRAYTYVHQPNNLAAWRLGKASPSPFDRTDLVDRGLSLLKALNENGFGVFEIDALTTAQEGR